MDVKENLVELIRDGRFKAEAICNENNDCQTCTISDPDGYCKYGYIADHLIAHGVTVQEWISVKERKPDLELVEAKADDFDLYACLATIKNDRARNGRYVGKVWYDGEQFIDSDCVDMTYNVTHWMPLPQPPKGE